MSRNGSDAEGRAVHDAQIDSCRRKTAMLTAVVLLTDPSSDRRDSVPEQPRQAEAWMLYEAVRRHGHGDLLNSSAAGETISQQRPKWTWPEQARIAGYTSSGDLPTTGKELRTGYHYGRYDELLTVLNSTGSAF